MFPRAWVAARSRSGAKEPMPGNRDVKPWHERRAREN